MSRRGALRVVLAVLATMAVFAAIAVSPVAAVGNASVHTGFLKTPSGSVYCDYLYGGATKSFRYVRCGFKGTLVPSEAKPHGGCGVVDFVGNRMVVHQTGRARTEPCAGDAGPFANPKAAHTVRYGRAWHRGPFRCSSSKAGMTCSNTSSHGFFIAHRHWRLF